MSSTVRSREALREIYRQANPRSIAKELTELDPHCQRFVELSPFVVIGTFGEAGQDASPRGGPPGFVEIADTNTLIMPDFPGNNRLDSLENIIENGRIGMLFLVPGVDETLRVNGRATIDADLALRTRSAIDGRLPITVIRVAVEQAYLHWQGADALGAMGPGGTGRPRIAAQHGRDPEGPD